MAYVDTLVQALKDEFETDVQFHESIPSTVSAPSVVVAPGDPFIEPREAASSLVRENWDVLVAVSLKETSSGIALMRKLSLRVRRAAVSAGAVWRQASGPQRLAGGDAAVQSQIVVSVNAIHFRYDANDILNQ